VIFILARPSGKPDTALAPSVSDRGAYKEMELISTRRFDKFSVRSQKYCGNLKLRLKVLESGFFSRGQTVSKNSKHWSNEKGRSSKQILFSGTILTGLTQPLNAYGYKYFSLLLLLLDPAPSLHSNQVQIFLFVIVLPICSTC
jgi:hypothetical protein